MIEAVQQATAVPDLNCAYAWADAHHTARMVHSGSRSMGLSVLDLSNGVELIYHEETIKLRSLLHHAWLTANIGFGRCLIGPRERVLSLERKPRQLPGGC